MKVTKLTLKILFLYFSIFFTFLLSAYLISFFSLKRFIFTSLLTISFTSLIFLISMILIYRNIKSAQKQTLPLHFNEVLGNNNKRNTNTYMNRIIDCSNIIYLICKNVPFILYFLGLIIPTLIAIIFKEKNIFILCLLSAFSSNIFYIFSRKIF